MSSKTPERHPLFEELLRALRRDPKGRPYFPPSFLSRLEERALEIDSGEELYLLVGELLKFASFLRRQKQAQTAGGGIVPLGAALVCQALPACQG